MKKIALVLALSLFNFTAQAEEMLLVFSASWCGPCKQFKADLKANPDVLALPVDIVDAEAVPKMAKDFKINRYPSFILVDVGPDGVIKPERVIARKGEDKTGARGYKGMQELADWVAAHTTKMRKK